ncbi:brain protein I3 [Echinops telfairi]|uniref:Brain protein I3 n=1 Tax=Echinops telfairi TaxID=9371 RepID=A0AC55CPM6_ECHTE|nr:brain protein I3 [Echinops telfairi]
MSTVQEAGAACRSVQKAAGSQTWQISSYSLREGWRFFAGRDRDSAFTFWHFLPAPSDLPPPTGVPTQHPRVYSMHSRDVTRYPANSIVVVGGCPVCRVGVLEDSFTFLGIFLAIILFPFGFICCFALRKRRCPNCGASFS